MPPAGRRSVRVGRKPAQREPELHPDVRVAEVELRQLADPGDALAHGVAVERERRGGTRAAPDPDVLVLPAVLRMFAPTHLDA
ncbi:hypothetical protein P3T27_005588 [Kitasatospora sp. MAA19]|nr:hypothetical protein [Kitasatospora sp. MAA19]